MKTTLSRFVSVTTIACITLSSLTAGCAGRQANPVAASRPGDYQMSCASIQEEMRHIDHNVQRLLPKSDKTARNVGLGIAGVFVWPAWFFMDFKQAEKVEVEAYRNRYEQLARIYSDKGCAKGNCATGTKRA